jgi:two-component system chemotaxis response regulator CheY
MSHSMTGLTTQKVLVIDDVEVFRKTVREILETFSTELEVIEAKDGQQGLATIISKSPDLIITDVNMPNMTGLELLENLKQNEALRLIPVIVMSSDPNNRLKSQQLGAEDFFQKPLKTEEVKKSIARILTR